MNRKQFLRNISMGAVAVAVLPMFPNQQSVKEVVPIKLPLAGLYGQLEIAGDGMYLCVDNSNKTGLVWKRIES